jgi:hypothetical protein
MDVVSQALSSSVLRIELVPLYFYYLSVFIIHNVTNQSKIRVAAVGKTHLYVCLYALLPIHQLGEFGRCIIEGGLEKGFLVSLRGGLVSGSSSRRLTWLVGGWLWWGWWYPGSLGFCGRGSFIREGVKQEASHQLWAGRTVTSRGFFLVWSSWAHNGMARCYVSHTFRNNIDLALELISVRFHVVVIVVEDTTRYRMAGWKNDG